MRQGQKGFTMVELIVSMAIIVLIGASVSVTTIQVAKSTEKNNIQMTAARQVQSAGYWINRDAQMAHTITTDNLTPPNFLLLVWVQRDVAHQPMYHSATYYFENLSNGVGRLKRRYWNDQGANEENVIAEYIYYNPADPALTSKVSYLSPVLTLQLTSLFEGTTETREYKITRRPNF